MQYLMKDRRRKEVQTCAENDQEEAEQAKADGFVGPRPHGDGRLSTLDDARLLSMCGPRRAVAFRRSGLALDRFPGRCAPRAARPGRAEIKRIYVISVSTSSTSMRTAASFVARYDHVLPFY